MKRDRWQQLADELGGYPVKKWSWDWLFKDYRVIACHKNWPLTFYIRHHGGEETDPNTPNHSTGVRAQFATHDGFRFVVVPTSGPRFVNNLLAKRCREAGLHEGSSGSNQCDERFAVYSTEPDRIGSWLEDNDLEHRLLNDPTTIVLVRDDEMGFQSIPARGVHELYVEIDGLIPLDQLHTLHDLTTRLLDRLHEIGIASGEDPTIRVDDVPVTIDRGWGTTALALGVAGMVLPIVGIPFALLARRLGNSDLKRIRAGELPWSASNLARLAKLSGTIGIAFQMIWPLLLVIVWMVAMMRS